MSESDVRGSVTKPRISLRSSGLPVTYFTKPRSPDHAGNQPGLAARRLDLFFQETMRLPPDISRTGIGPGPAFIVGGAGGLAGFVALAAFDVEIAVIAAEPVDRGFDRAVARFHHAGAAYARNAAGILDPRRHAALQPAYRAAADLGRIAKTPGPTAPVVFADQRTIDRIAGGDRRVLIVTARTIEIGLGVCRPRDGDGHQES